MAFPIPRFPSVVVVVLISEKHADTCLNLFLFIVAMAGGGRAGAGAGVGAGGGDISGERLSS